MDNRSLIVAFNQRAEALHSGSFDWSAAKRLRVSVFLGAYLGPFGWYPQWLTLTLLARLVGRRSLVRVTLTVVKVVAAR